MNVQRSFQWCDRTTASYHFCHVYGLLNQIDSSSLSDGQPSGHLSSDMVLLNSSDLRRIMGNFAVLVSTVQLSCKITRARELLASFTRVAHELHSSCS